MGPQLKRYPLGRNERIPVPSQSCRPPWLAACWRLFMVPWRLALAVGAGSAWLSPSREGSFCGRWHFWWFRPRSAAGLVLLRESTHAVIWWSAWVVLALAFAYVLLRVISVIVLGAAIAADGLIT